MNPVLSTHLINFGNSTLSTQSSHLELRLTHKLLPHYILEDSNSMLYDLDIPSEYLIQIKKENKFNVTIGKPHFSQSTEDSEQPAHPRNFFRKISIPYILQGPPPPYSVIQQNNCSDSTNQTIQIFCYPLSTNQNCSRMKFQGTCVYWGIDTSLTQKSDHGLTSKCRSW